MITMLSETVRTLVVILLSFGAVTALWNRKSRILPYIRYLLSLILLLSLLSPVLPLFRYAEAQLATHFPVPGESAAGGGTSVYEETAILYAKALCEDRIRQLLMTKTGIPIDAMTVCLTTDDSDPTAVVVTSAEVRLSNARYRIAADKLRAYCEELLCCPCTVAIARVADEKGEE